MSRHSAFIVLAFLLCAGGIVFIFTVHGPLNGASKPHRPPAGRIPLAVRQKTPQPVQVTSAHVQQRLTDDTGARRPIVVHVVVALCDNRHQGIAPVSAKLGNGRDPGNNLYWGAMYGVRTFLSRKAGWTIAAKDLPAPGQVLDKIILHGKVPRSGRDADVYIVAEAWDGKEIKGAIRRFFTLAAGGSPEVLTVGGHRLNAGGAAHLVAYIGHNGLMEFTIAPLPARDLAAKPRSAAVLACKSKPYFLVPLRTFGAHPLILTTGLMAPEAYTLDALVRAWASGQLPQHVRDKSAAAYHKYQHCGLTGARRLFAFEP